MIAVLRNTWALLFGMFLLQLGNGMQATALGLRGGIEDFSAATMGYVMTGYFIGFMGGAQATPWLLRRVGHVRVFAALASMISVAFIIYAAWVDPVGWFLMRVLAGFCFSGVYVVAESWLNDGVDNENRGQALSVYLIMQMGGIVLAQALVNFADPGGFLLFIFMSVAVSIAITPILLSVSPVPMFAATRRMSLIQLFKSSPLGCFGCFMLGAIFGAMFGMSSVYTTEIGLSTQETALFIGIIYLGGLLCQYPLGWLSDRMDRRVLITAVTGIGCFSALMVPVLGFSFSLLLISGFLIGGMANPLYSLLIAHTNDFLEHEDMASAAGGLVILNGIGAIGMPILVGYLMGWFGPTSFLWSIAVAMGIVTTYGMYRMTVRASTPVAETLPQVPYGMIASAVAAEMASEVVAEQAQTDAELENDQAPA
ncbi:MAG: MFS transporter [Pseudomonadota bacterium]